MHTLKNQKKNAAVSAYDIFYLAMVTLSLVFILVVSVAGISTTPCMEIMIYDCPGDWLEHPGEIQQIGAPATEEERFRAT